MRASPQLSILRAALALLCGTMLVACGGDSKNENETAANKEGGAITVTPTPGKGTDPVNPTPAAPPELPAPDTVLVTVNGETITQADVNEVLSERYGRGQKLDDAQLARIVQVQGKQVAESMIVPKLLDQEIAKEGIRVTDLDLAEAWEDVKKNRLPKGMTLEMALARQGLTQAVADEKMREQLLQKKLFDIKAPLRDVTDEEAKAYYEKNIGSFKIQEKVTARHVLVMTKDPAEKAEKRKEIEDIRARLVENKGQNFADVAKECSECPSKKDGGSLGSFGRGQMVPEFDKMAFELEPGVISPIIETKFGFHVIMVDEKQAAGVKPFEEVADTIKRQMASGDRKPALDKFLADLKEQAKIEWSGDAAPGSN